MGGFTSDGKYYDMGYPPEDYIEYCKNLLLEIRNNADAKRDKSKLISLNHYKSNDTHKPDYTSLVLKHTKSF